MSRKQKILTWIAAALITAGAAVRLRTWHDATKPFVLTGAVLREDTDPAKQSPIVNVTVTELGNSSTEIAKSDASGLFKLTIHPGLLPGRPITLRFEHAEYQSLELLAPDANRIYVARMEPLTRDSVSAHTEAPGKKTQIKHVRVRYSLKSQNTINVGSVAKQFEVVNVGNVPCKGERPCSPDGKWKASTSTISLDAEKGNEFRDVRVSCIAGPCPFTNLRTGDLSRTARKIEIAALNWSDTASFLVEAEVIRTMATNAVLQSYPFIIGTAMSFALPGAAEGPSIVADINTEEIVFPLGPSLLLTWADCTVENAAGGSRLYRCELKPGYVFLQ